MKTCKRCNSTLPLERFQKDNRRDDGRGSYCKPCHVVDSIKWNNANKDKKKLHKQKWEAKNPDKVAAQSARTKARRKTKNLRRFLTLNLAHTKVKYEIDRGRMKKECCIVCKKLYQKEVAAVAHHCDYNKPLEVTWLCPQHHAAWHRIFLPEEKLDKAA